MSVVINTAGKMELPRSSDISPTPNRVKDGAILKLQKESDLATTVLKLLRSDNLKLRAATETQLRLEIGLRLDMDATKLRRYEETISELYNKVDELETMVANLSA